MKIENISFALLKVLAKTLGNALGGGFAGDLLVEVLPEVAKDGWAWWNKEKDEQARRSELEAIVQSGNAQLRQEISAIVRAELAAQPPAIQQTVELYLTQLPASIRRALRRPDDPNGVTVPANLALHKAEDLLRLLPVKLAHFQPGDQPLPGVDWQLEQLLGVGGFGEVWKARNPHLQSVPPVALKFCIEPAAARSLRNEARVLDQVMRQGRQPGMVQLLHTYLSAQTPCLEYEFVEGGDLGGLIQAWHRQEGGPTPVQAARTVLRLAAIMAVAHAANPPIVHRDLKPANILVYKDAKQADEIHFKIADFGIGGVAAQQAVRESQMGLSRGKLLVSGLQGSYTQHYASPQQMRGDDPDPRDDVFALGVIWWQMLTGDLGAGRPGGSRWSRRLSEKGMADGLIDLLSACFEEEPADRPANAGALAKALQVELLEDLAPSSGAIAQTVQPSPAPAVGIKATSEVASDQRKVQRGFFDRLLDEEQTATPQNKDQRGFFDRLFGAQQTATPPATPVYSSTEQSKIPTPKLVVKPAKIDFAWVHIPAGEFLMGSDKRTDKEAQDAETPQHKLYLPDYYIARVPVTVAQFTQFINATGHKTLAEEKGLAWNWAEKDGKWQWLEIKGAYWAKPSGPQSDVNAKSDHPVTCVSFYDVQAFCTWAGVRLPTEAEWEKAARGTDGRIYPWGNQAPDKSLGNFNMDVRDTTPVGSYAKGASPYGCLDMAGNVVEWTSSLWGKDVNKPAFGYPYKATDGRESGAGDDYTIRIARGGGWTTATSWVRAAARYSYPQFYRSVFLGFRVVGASPGS